MDSSLNNAVMISIKPGWNNLIELGKKTLEVRKNAPNIPTPFKAYIYETKDNGRGRGAVTGEFICDYIRCEDIPYPAFQDRLDPFLLAESCIRYYDLHRYAYHDNLYFWHISQLKRYSSPIELHMFRRYGHDKNDQLLETTPLNRAPQSWCYVIERRMN